MQMGTLYLVPTPIGNLEDMTYRGVRILSEVDLICAEDTRQTRKLLSHYEIHTKMMSMHEHNEQSRSKMLVGKIKEGESVALVSDAGTPLVSDPGETFVKDCITEGITVTPLPGANAAVTALVASGLGGGAFHFHGFLPRKKKDLLRLLDELSVITVPMIFYESPHRMKTTLQVLKDQWGERAIVVGRELTKRFEQFHRGTIRELYEASKDDEWRGEICVIIEGATEEETQSKAAWWQELSIKLHVEAYEEQGYDRKAAMKKCALERGLSKNEVYSHYHGLNA